MEVIKKLLRWASDEALHIYVRMNSDAIAEWIGAARTVSISITSVCTSTLPAGVSIVADSAVVPDLTHPSYGSYSVWVILKGISTYIYIGV